MKIPPDFYQDTGITAVHITSPPTLQARLYAGHMELVGALLRAQTQLHESGYVSAVRSALVGPAHRAVQESLWALASAAARAPGSDSTEGPAT